VAPCCQLWDKCAPAALIANLQSTIYNLKSMDPARIQKLLGPFQKAGNSEDLANGQEPTANRALIQNISTYIDLLLRWNSRINLTAIRDPEEIVSRHFGESLFAASHLFPNGLANDHRRTTTDVIDVGSGPGFPGLPVKLWAPHIHLTLIESNHKKASFLREVIRTLTLTNVDVFAGRAQDFPSTADVITLRAVEHFEEVLPIAAGLVVPGGRMALLIGSSQVAQARKLVPFQWESPLPIPAASQTALLIGINSRP
jgi:16S rRNA (guanine527-N7)-methyltransferase